jgi:hypothetical protein
MVTETDFVYIFVYTVWDRARNPVNYGACPSNLPPQKKLINYSYNDPLGQCIRGDVRKDS